MNKLENLLDTPKFKIIVKGRNGKKRFTYVIMNKNIAFGNTIYSAMLSARWAFEFGKANRVTIRTIKRNKKCKSFKSVKDWNDFFNKKFGEGTSWHVWRDDYKVKGINI